MRVFFSYHSLSRHYDRISVNHSITYGRGFVKNTSEDTLGEIKLRISPINRTNSINDERINS
ncbi:hypothetical protein HZS_5633 [Henneguya salminicola]|nr:hypothetical protein HZS_5633 [Henneguya salminicola]